VIVAVACRSAQKARGNPDLGGARSENFFLVFPSDALAMKIVVIDGTT
jgi:hypothetical protein